MNSYLKKSFIRLTLLCACLFFSLLLTSCRDYDETVLNFYTDTCDAKYNAIELDLGKNNSGIYFIEEQYGIWTNEGEKFLFDFYYIPQKHGGGALTIRVATRQSYYDSMACQNDGFASIYKGKMVFSGICEFSNNETIATISPNNIYDNEMSISSGYTVTLTKTIVPEDNIISLDVALDNMNYVPGAYFEFLTNQKEMKYSCGLADWWVNASTMIGEWSTNGSIIPIRLKLHEKVPYVEIYDISESTEKVILKSYANVVDSSKIELIEPEGEMFYSIPSSPVTITKTS